MTLDSGGGGSGGTTTPRRPRKRNIIPVYNGSGSGSGSTPVPGANLAMNRNQTSTGTGTKSGSGGKSGGMSAYEKRAAATAAAAQAAAANKYRVQAKNLAVQAAALKHALRIDLRKGLRQQLGDVEQVSDQQDKILMQGYRERYGQLRGASRDNEKAQASQSGINNRNMLRERNSAVSEAAAQGAGESDTLSSMLMSLRNWHANQNEVQRDYHDTLRSVNSSLTDLNVDTKTARTNNEIQSNADKEMLWTNYHNQRSELFTQLGNTRGQQADYYASANEMDKAPISSSSSSSSTTKKSASSKKTAAKKTVNRPGWSGAPQSMQRSIPVPRPGTPGHRQPAKKAAAKKTAAKKSATSGPIDTVKEARNAAAGAFMNSAQELGKSWNNPGVGKKLMRWDGRDDFDVTNNNVTRLKGAMTVRLDKVPEGATLRKW